MADGAAAVEDLQFTLGEGPGVDAYSQGRSSFVEDLAEMVDRWTQFVPAAQALGIMRTENALAGMPDYLFDQ